MTVEVSPIRWRALLFCVGIAIISWSFNALSKSYTTVIQHPVNFTINEKKLVFKKAPPQVIPVEVTGKGWTLLRYQLKLYIQPIELPVNKVARRGRVVHTRLYTLLKRHIKDVRVEKVLVSKLRIHTASKPASK